MPPLAIACGDHAGIGPEVVLKALAAEEFRERTRDLVVIGDRRHLEQLVARERGSTTGSGAAKSGPGNVPFRIEDPRREPLPEAKPPGGPETARAAVDYLRHGAEGCLRGEFSGLVTGPVSKSAIARAGIPFVGQTEFLAQVAGIREVTMMLLGNDDRGRWLRVALATTHLPLRDVPTRLDARAVERAIRHAGSACRQLGLERPRIAVCGLNPHAGEDGLLGDEESRVIAPAIVAAWSHDTEIIGPLSGDTVFHHALRGDYDAVVAMYHDQGLAPLKLAAFDRGVNWTLGLPFIRTSPDHGTAFDIVGQGAADPSSMQAAIRLALRLAGTINGPTT